MDDSVLVDPGEDSWGTPASCGRIGLLGAGGFGSVTLEQHKKTKKMYYDLILLYYFIVDYRTAVSCELA